MEQSRLHSFESQCTQEDPPACQTMCPLHVDVRPVARLMAEGKPADARKILDRAVPLSGLMGYLCEGPCKAFCRRAEVDEAVNMPLVERVCVSLTRSLKPMALPSNGKRAVVLGAGLSSLVVAFELARKGYNVALHHAGKPGGRLRALGPDVLPERALAETLEMLEALRVSFVGRDALSLEILEGLGTEGSAAYIGLDDASVTPDAFGIHMRNGAPVLDPLTLETNIPGLFAGGWPGGCPESPGAGGGAAFILEAADGRRAAGSMDRLLKGVSPSTAREREGVYASALFTNLSDVPSIAAIKPVSPLAPTQEEAAREAARCIQCECLECVKRCAYLARYKGYPKRYAREIYNNLAVVHGQRRANTQINSCAGCGLCAAVCPFNADMGAYCADARRDMVLGNRMPPRPHEFALQDMEFSNAPDVAFFRHQPGRTQSARAFFPGCQLPASMPGQTERVYAHLCEHLDGGVGFLFSCCGAPARWTGRPQLTASVAGALKERWAEAGRPELILACSSCAAFFAAELPEIPARPLWDVLAGLPMPKGAVAGNAVLALHDPCVTRNNPVTQQNARSLAKALGQEIEELTLGRALTRCCGYGGLAAYADPEIGDLYAGSRAGDTQNTLLSYCVMCRDRLRSAGSPSLHLLDLLFPLNDAIDAGGAVPEPGGAAPDPGGGSFDARLEKAAWRPAPGISDRQENRLCFRRRILGALWGESPESDPRAESLVLNISDAVAGLMEERRILRSDVKTVIQYAEEHGGLFFHPATGRSLACLRPRQVSFWVEFTREADGRYTVHDAYCHRMVVPGVPGRGAPSPCTLEGYAAKGGRM